ncbi:hypothetical protein H0H87_002273 [Tephrocybe sp. NHM501043]|nr:hypothetical protein H0H87_002273 [Tephrocybe sp. NHM501043]
MFSLPTAASRQNFTLPNIPELYDPDFLDVLLKVEPQTLIETVKEAPKNSMMEALKATSHHALTQNLAPTYKSTLDPVLDAFQLLSSAITLEQFDKYLADSWSKDAEMTLRIIWNIRSIHDGKGDKELAFGWLYEYHPRTAIRNLPMLVEPVCSTPKSKKGLAHGYWKDLLNILTLAVMDELHIAHQPSTFLHPPRDKYQYNDIPGSFEKCKRESAAQIAKSLAKDAENHKAATKKRILVAAERHANLVKKLSIPKFRALYIAVARLFSARLTSDLHLLDQLDSLGPDEGRNSLLKQISLAGKWAPTPMCAHDRHTNIATAIVMLLRHSNIPSKYPSALDVASLEPQEEAIILRSFYQRWVLTRLRSVSAVTEPLMVAKQWTEIKYTRVPSKCMDNNMERFFTHDRAGFQKYLASVKKGHKKISGATLFPHELVAKALALGKPVTFDEDHEFTSLKEFKMSLSGAQIEVVEAQWKTLIGRLRESGSLNNALAICDVSGSMGVLPGLTRPRLRNSSTYVQPILPAISLSLVLASLAGPPFNGGFITFSENPKFVELDLTRPLSSIVSEMSNAHWSMNTDLNAVFLKLLLPLAIKNKVPQEEMIKRLFIFSDMQFDAASSVHSAGDWKTNHDEIVEAYRKEGYEVPQIVYWDLSRHGTVEAQSDREGVALMNGFSPAMLKVFMGENEENEWEEVTKDGEAKTVKVKEEFNPVSVMKKALMKQSFEGLIVVD